MLHEDTGNKLLVFLPLSGLASGLLTNTLVLGGQEAPLFSGVIFGLFLAYGLLISRILTSLWKAVVLMAVSTVAYFFSFCAAFGVQLNFPQIVPSSQHWNMSTNEPAAPIALLVGGLVGGFLIFGVVLLLSYPRFGAGPAVRRLAFGTILGGLLGVAGWALRSSVGVGLWSLFHALRLTATAEAGPRTWFGGEYDYTETVRMYSLYVVWQTGVAAAIALMFRLGPKAGKNSGGGVRK